MIYRAINGSPDENLTRVIELAGGIENIIGEEDVVLIKPNVQWWNQGAPNLAALNAFVDLVMNRPGGFTGEVVIAENCHRGSKPWDARRSGWVPQFERNSDLKNVHNMKDLTLFLKKKYGNKYTTYHVIDVASGNKRVFGPQDGTGYVYCDGTGGVPLISLDNGASGDDYRAVIMSYPILETDQRTIIDFKNGVWEKGAYTGQPVRFINFAALNHHSRYSGMTSAIKNYLGVNDISGGPDCPDNNNGGLLTDHYFNFHQFPYNVWNSGPVPGMLGAEIGLFMKTIRKADMNITTAEWIGLASRTEPPVARTRAVLASSDPVALDYHATKYLLFPNSKIPIHNPDNSEGPLFHDLKLCAEQMGGTLDESNVAIKSYDNRLKSFQEDTNLIVKGEKLWGNDVKAIMRYLYLVLYNKNNLLGFIARHFRRSE